MKVCSLFLYSCFAADVSGDDAMNLLQAQVHRSLPPGFQPWLASTTAHDYFTPGGLPGWSVRYNAQSYGRQSDGNSNQIVGIRCTCNDGLKGKFQAGYFEGTEVAGIDTDVKCAAAALKHNSRVFSIRRLDGPNYALGGIECILHLCRAGDAYASIGISCPKGCARSNGFAFQRPYDVNPVVQEWATVGCPNMTTYIYGENAIGEVNYGGKSNGSWGGVSKVPESGISKCKTGWDAGEWEFPLTTQTTTNVHTGQVQCLADRGFAGFDCFGEEGFQAVATQEYCDGGYDFEECCKPWTCASLSSTTTTTQDPCPGGDGCNPCGDACFPTDQDCFDAEHGFGPDFSCATTDMWCGHDSGDGITVGMCCPDQCKKEVEKKKKTTKEEARKKNEQERKDKRRKNELERKAKGRERNKKRTIQEWISKRDKKEKENKVKEDERKSKRKWDEAKRKKERGWKQRRAEKSRKANNRERIRKRKETQWKNGIAEKKNKNQNGSKEKKNKERRKKKVQARKEKRKKKKGGQ